MSNFRVYPESKVLSLVEALQLEIEYRKNKTEEQTPFFESNLGKLYRKDCQMKFISKGLLQEKMKLTLLKDVKVYADNNLCIS